MSVAFRAFCRICGSQRAVWARPIHSSPCTALASQWRSVSAVTCSNPIPLAMRPAAVRCALIPSAMFPLIQHRNVVFCSKLGKRKTVKAVAKRFKRTGTGKLKYWKSGKNHKMLAKTKRSSRELRKPCYVTNTQLKTLNKMLAGW